MKNSLLHTYTAEFKNKSGRMRTNTALGAMWLLRTLVMTLPVRVALATKNPSYGYKLVLTCTLTLLLSNICIAQTTSTALVTLPASDIFNSTTEVTSAAHPSECDCSLIDLHVAALFPHTGWYPAGQALLIATEMALEDVNKDPTMLPGYRLNIHQQNTKVRTLDGLLYSRYIYS